MEMEQMTFFYWLMGISGGLVTILVGVVLVLIKGQAKMKSEADKRRDVDMRELVEKVDGIVKKVEIIMSDLKVYHERSAHRDINCKGIHEVVDKRLYNHEKRIAEIEKEVVEIKTQLKK